MAKLKFNKAGWNQIVKQVIETEGLDRMQRVAEACNLELVEHDHDDAEGFRLSTEGDDKLDPSDYRATVITATAPAMAHNARHNTLVNHFHLAGGD